MAYYIKFQEIESACLLLSSLALSSKEYTKVSLDLNINTKKDEYEITEFDLDILEHNDWLTHQAHSNLVYCAIQTRLLLDQDILEPKDPDDESDPIAYAPIEAYDKYKPIVHSKGLRSLSLRECCNKIIHARNIEFSYEHLSSDASLPEYWNGEAIIKGAKDDNPWEIVIDIPKLCFTIKYYLSTIKYLT